VLLYSYQRRWEIIVPTSEEKFNDGMNILLSTDQFDDGLPHHSPNQTSIIKKDQMNHLIVRLYVKLQSLKMRLYTRFEY
jgi:hypothetical protein